MDTGVCFSPGAIALLASIWVVIQGTIVSLFWLLIRAKDAQVAKAEAREAEWRRVAVRGANEIIPPLVSAVRVDVRDQLQQLGDPS